MHKTAAWPLALLYAALVVYASLYPFAEWRDQGIAPWSFLQAPVHPYWTGFDVAINMLGYGPLGALLAVSMMRMGSVRHPVFLALATVALLSFGMEALQSYLPARVPSREDFLLNTLGGALGAVMAWVLERVGAIASWSRIRRRWFVADASGGMVLLATWPMALLFPAAVPFGLGQVLDRVKLFFQDYLQDTPFALPMTVDAPGPLTPVTELLCVVLGLLIPCLLGYCIVRRAWRRAVFVLCVLMVGVAVTSLSAAMSWGPVHAWAWLNLATRIGMVLALMVALLLITIPWRASAALLLVVLGVYLSLLNQAPGNAYFALTLQAWEQGRFIRFHGLAQWLGWVWPYAVLVYALTQIWGRDSQN
jgi:VanZ family protein